LPARNDRLPRFFAETAHVERVSGCGLVGGDLAIDEGKSFGNAPEAEGRHRQPETGFVALGNYQSANLRALRQQKRGHEKHGK
jgi:hypothetical protein